MPVPNWFFLQPGLQGPPQPPPPVLGPTDPGAMAARRAAFLRLRAANPQALPPIVDDEAARRAASAADLAVGGPTGFKIPLAAQLAATPAAQHPLGQPDRYVPPGRQGSMVSAQMDPNRQAAIRGETLEQQYGPDAYGRWLDQRFGGRMGPGSVPDASGRPAITVPNALGPMQPNPAEEAARAQYEAIRTGNPTNPLVQRAAAVRQQLGLGPAPSQNLSPAELRVAMTAARTAEQQRNPLDPTLAPRYHQRMRLARQGNVDALTAGVGPGEADYPTMLAQRIVNARREGQMRRISPRGREALRMLNMLPNGGGDGAQVSPLGAAVAFGPAGLQATLGQQQLQQQAAELALRTKAQEWAMGPGRFDPTLNAYLQGPAAGQPIDVEGFMSQLGPLAPLGSNPAPRGGPAPMTTRRVEQAIRSGQPEAARQELNLARARGEITQQDADRIYQISTTGAEAPPNISPYEAQAQREMPLMARFDFAQQLREAGIKSPLNLPPDMGGASKAALQREIQRRIPLARAGDKKAIAFLRHYGIPVR